MEVYNAIILVILTVYYAWSPARALRKYGFSFVPGIQIGIFYFLIIPFWLALLNGSLAVPPDFNGTLIPEMNWMGDSFSIFLMLLPLLVVGILFAGYRNFLSRLPHKAGEPVVRRDVPGEFKSYFWLYVVVALFAYFATGLADGGHWYRTREEFSADNGLAGALLLYSVSATRILFLAGAMVAFLSGRATLTRVATYIAVACALDLYTTGNRIFTLQSVLAVALGLLILRRRKALLAGAMLLVPFGIVMGTFRWARAYMHSYEGTGLGGALSGLASGVQFAVEQVSTNGFGVTDFVSSATESVNANVYLAIVSNFPTKHPYLYGASLYKLLVFFIPRSAWPGKPDSITVTIGDFLAPGSQVSLVSTMFGECFANFGLFGLFLSPLLLILAWSIVYRLMRRYAISGVACFVFAFTLVRMAYSDVIVTAAVMAAYAYMISFLKRGRTRRARAGAQGADYA